MRIALDASYSLGKNLSGVGVYSRRMMWGLAEAHPEARWSYYYRPHRWMRSWGEELPRGARRRLLWRGARGDVFHALNQRVDEGCPARTVATFHDLFVMTAEYSTGEFRARFEGQAREAAARSARIIAVSEFTAGQVETLLGVERSRIRVIPHGVDWPERVPGPERREQTILFTGAIQKRKNVERLVEAFEGCEPGWKLVLAGAAGYGAEEILARIARSPRREWIETPGYVSEGELRRLYESAGVFAFPSLDEGFGMPVLEAMAWGVPVMTSNRSAMPEVAGQAALLVDPAETESVRDGLRKMTEDEGLRGRLAELGRARSAKFPWKLAVEKTWAVYQELLRDAG